MAVKIKICGIRDYEDALLCLEQGADALGFIFYPRSPRYVMPKQAKKIIRNLPCFISKVGVFVDEEARVVDEIASSIGLDTLQFHGKESASFCGSFRNRFKVIKSFFPQGPEILFSISRYKVDGVLLDIPFKEKGKNPKLKLALDLVKRISPEVEHLILSGGLSGANVGALVKGCRPYAVDVARGVEQFPGKKSRALVKEFIKAARKVNA